ncbi:MAG: phosphoglycolate phosphatase [Robiginitomaculum sp.]|nr:MAG: phosphoglycolate phosphatase [Robiginitomaculum sp.]
MTKTAIFDLDGTLVDSAPDLHAAANQLLLELGRPGLSLTTITGFIGHGIPNLVNQVLLASGLSKEQTHLARYMEIYAGDPVSHGRLYPGVRAALEQLDDANWRLGICTNKAGAMTDLVLTGHRIDHLFGAVVSGDSMPQKKPDPSPLLTCAQALGAKNQQTFYVGDSETDAMTAHNAKLPFLLYSEGYRSAQIDEMVHAKVFSDWTKLPDYLETLAGQ